MRYGYWMPVFGGWLRNVEDENMQASWDYVSRLARRSEELGYDITLVAELLLNDIKGINAPSLDAWSTAAALVAVTQTLEVMVAVRPSFHPPIACEAGRDDRSDLEWPSLAQRGLCVVEGRGAALRRRIRRAR